MNDIGFEQWPSSKLLGSSLIGWDEESGTVKMAFVASPEFANMRGYVQGGIVGAFLDEAMGAAMYFSSKGTQMQLTLDMNLSLMRPVEIGPISAKAKVIKSGRRVVFIESELFAPDGRLCARATATSIPTPMPGHGEEADGLPAKAGVQT